MYHVGIRRLRLAFFNSLRAGILTDDAYRWRQHETLCEGTLSFVLQSLALPYLTSSVQAYVEMIVKLLLTCRKIVQHYYVYFHLIIGPPDLAADKYSANIQPDSANAENESTVSM